MQNIFEVDEALVKRNIRLNLIDKLSLAGIAIAEIKLIALGNQNTIEMDQFEQGLISEDYEGDLRASWYESATQYPD
jgi:hypothetical protein